MFTLCSTRICVQLRLVHVETSTGYVRGSQTFTAFAPLKMFHELSAPSYLIDSNKQILHKVWLMNTILF
jgi:hypothetical protein